MTPSSLFLISLLIFQISCFVQEKLESSTVKEQPIDKIVGGVTCNVEKVPWIVAILESDNYGIYHCGGSLLTYQWILTAAHCIKEEVIPDKRIIISAGSNFPLDVGYFHDRRKREPDRYVQKRIVNFGLKHPKYYVSNTEARYDIGLLRVYKPFDPHPKVRPLTLPTPGLARTCRMGIVAGWGETEVKFGEFRSGLKSSGPFELKINFKNPLRCVELPLINLTQCLETYPQESFQIDDTVLCTMFKSGGKDSCYGDSGGPLMCDGAVVGIVKGGNGCALKNVAALYTNVESYLDFVGSYKNIPEHVGEVDYEWSKNYQKGDKSRTGSDDSNKNVCVGVKNVTLVFTVLLNLLWIKCFYFLQ